MHAPVTWKEWAMKDWRRCPEILWEKGRRKVEIARGGLHYERRGQSGRRMETKSNRKKHVQNVDRERSERNLAPDDRDANGQQPQYAS